MKIKISEIRKLLNSILIKYGLNKNEASSVLEEYLDAELKGKTSHGLMSFPKIINKLKDRKKYKVMKDKGCYMLIDGKEGLGAIAGDFAIKKAIKKAKKFGIALVGLSNIKPFMTPVTFARLAVNK